MWVFAYISEKERKEERSVCVCVVVVPLEARLHLVAALAQRLGHHVGDAVGPPEGHVGGGGGGHGCAAVEMVWLGDDPGMNGGRFIGWEMEVEAS